MSRDRLSELQRQQESLQPFSRDDEPLGPARTGPGTGGGATSMAAFLEEVNLVQAGIETVRETVRHIEQIHARQLTHVTEEQTEKLNYELDGLVADTSKQLKSLKNCIRAIEIANEKVPASSGDAQIRTSQAASLKKKFMDTAKMYQSVEQTHRQKIREQMERQYRIVRPNATSDEVEDYLSGQQDIFAQEVLYSTRHGEATRVLQEVQNRHEDMRKIEQTIMDLADLFQEMSMQVDLQGGMLDSIEKNVGNAAAYTEEAVGHIDKAIVYRKNTRKKLWLVMGVCFVLAIVAAAMVYIFVIKPALPVSSASAPSAVPAVNNTTTNTTPLPDNSTNATAAAAAATATTTATTTAEATPAIATDSSEKTRRK